MQILDYDHLVLTVENLEQSCDFYKTILNMRAELYNSSAALFFNGHRINLHLKGHELLPNAKHKQVGSADFCLLCDGELDEYITHLKKHKIKIIEGPIERQNGRLLSIYFYDPSGNLIEIAKLQK